MPTIALFNKFTLIQLNTPLSKVEGDNYGLTLYVNDTITRTGVNNGQLCGMWSNGAVRYIGNGDQYIQFSSDMAYLIQNGTMYLCYDNNNVSYKNSTKGLVIDKEGYV